MGSEVTIKLEITSTKSYHTKANVAFFLSGAFPNVKKLTLLKGETENIVNTFGISKWKKTLKQYTSLDLQVFKLMLQYITITQLN